MTTASEKDRKEKKRKIVNVGISLICGCFVFFLTSMLGYFTDDWHFRFVFNGFMPEGNEQRVSNIEDIVISMKNYYQLSGGRVFAHSILYGLLMLPKWVFNIMNACIFVCVGRLIYKLAYEKKEYEAEYLFLVFMLLFLWLPSFGDTSLWLSGSVNYMWMSLFPLSFLYFMQKGNYWKSLFAAFFSGFTNEATAGVLIVYLIAKHLMEKKKIGWRELLQMTMMLPGTFFVLMAPGNYNRAQIINQTEVFSAKVTLKMLTRTLIWMVKGPYIFLIAAILFFTIFFWQKKGRFIIVWSYLAASVAGMMALSLSGTFLVRAQYINVILLIIAFVKSISVSMGCFVEEKDQNSFRVSRYLPIAKLRHYCRWTAIIAVFLIISYMIFQVICFTRAAISDIERMHVIEEAVIDRKETIMVSKNIHFTAGAFYPEEGAASKEYEALWMGMYYGIKINVL